jgi:hypothetical protein
MVQKLLRGPKRGWLGTLSLWATTFLLGRNMEQETIDEIADRLDRQADRYRNAGDLKPEREARAAADAVRHTSDLGQAQNIDKSFNLTHESSAGGDPAPQHLDPGTSGHFGEKGYVVYDGDVRSGGSRAWRNNNPGNMEAGSFANSHGAIGTDGRMAIFPDAETGRKALASLLSGDTYAGLTIAEALEKYAPAIENDVEAYVEAITKQTGLSEDTVLGDMSSDELGSVMNAIQTHEGWSEGEVYDGGADSPDWAREVMGVSGTDDS